MRGSTYEPLTRLGGTEAEVWLGVLEGSAGFRRPVVLKRARAPEAREELVRESLVAAALRHPNVVHVYDLLEDGGELVLVMEHVPGLSLHGLLAHLRAGGGRFPWPLAARVVADAARGLAHAHGAVDAWGRSLAVVHRDVSPSNLLLAEDGRTQVCDFGIARSRLSEVTRHGVVRGTPGYLSPEQAAGRPLDWRSDVFSLGAVLFELLWGAPLLGADVAAGLSRLARQGLPAPPPELPSTLGDLARRMLAFEAARRTVSMEAVADTLDELTLGRGGSQRDLRAFLWAELGGLLQHRRRRLAQLLRGEQTDPSRWPRAETSTIVLLESHLDRPESDTFTELAPLDAEDEEGDPTEIDPGAAR